LRLLIDQQTTNTILSSQKLRIVSQDELYSTVLIPCSSNIMDELENIFKIEGSFNLNRNESRNFLYIDKPISWKG
jgi:hypothetical protein